MRTAGGHVSLLWDLAHGRAPRGDRYTREGESLLRLWAAPRIFPPILLAGLNLPNPCLSFHSASRVRLAQLIAAPRPAPHPYMCCRRASSCWSSGGMRAGGRWACCSWATRAVCTKLK